MKQLYILVLSILCICNHIQGQNLSNRGKEFWVGYGSHVAMYEPERIPIQGTNQTQPNPNAGKPLAFGGEQIMVL
ncbi:MAG: hypothetical protein RL642_653 [Bacteroidota bacterium]